MSKTGVKYDQDKPMWRLVPFKQLESIVDILTFGIKKYSIDNWKKVPDGQERYFDAMMRHILAWQMGEKNDPETGKSHLAHAGCNLFFVMWFDDQKQEPDKKELIFNLDPAEVHSSYKPLLSDEQIKKSKFFNKNFNKKLIVGQGIASLSTSPVNDVVEKNCCYSNMGNAAVNMCSPEEILKCLQKKYDKIDVGGSAWFNSEIMVSKDQFNFQNEFKYIGDNSTGKSFLFQLIDNKFKVINND